MDVTDQPRCKRSSAWSSLGGHGLSRIVVGLAVALAMVATSPVHAQSPRQHPILSSAFQQAADTASGSRLTVGNRFGFLENGVQALPRMLALIGNAQHELWLTTMLFNNDSAGKQVSDALIGAAQRGVRVRVIADGRLASWRITRRLRRGGCFVERYNPYWDIGGRTGRQHQKIVVADLSAAIVGGMNIADEYLFGTGNDDYYKDTAVEVRGFGAAEVARRFLELWTELDPLDTGAQNYLALAGVWTQPQQVHQGDLGTGRYIVQHSDLGDDAIRAYYKMCFDVASSHIVWHVNNVRPAGEVLDGLRDAARRGVRVVILTNSKKAYMRRNGRLAGWFQYWAVRLIYQRRLRGTGIEVWESPVAIHSKALSVDGVMASVGSYNFSDHSDQNLESNMICYDPQIIAAVEAMFVRDLRRSQRADP